MKWRINQSDFPRLDAVPAPARDRIYRFACYTARRRWPYRLTMLAFNAAFSATIVLPYINPFSTMNATTTTITTITTTGVLLVIALFIIALVTLRRMERRFIHEAIETLVGARCAACGHNLAGLEHQSDDTRVCPECGVKRKCKTAP